MCVCLWIIVCVGILMKMLLRWGRRDTKTETDREKIIEVMERVIDRIIKREHIFWRIATFVEK